MARGDTVGMGRVLEFSTPLSVLDHRSPACERCGAPWEHGFTFGRWCRGRCDRGRQNRRLLVLGCSATKRPAAGPVPAWELYDGPLYRDCRKLQREGRWPPDTGVRILSAEYGLIRPETLIEPYDRRMDRARAERMQWFVNTGVALSVFEEEAGEVYLAMGEDYQLAVARWYAKHCHVVDGSAEIGIMRQRLRTWLLANAPPEPQYAML